MVAPGSGAGFWERAAVGAGRASGGSTWNPTAAATLTRWSAPPALAPHPGRLRQSAPAGPRTGRPERRRPRVPALRKGVAQNNTRAAAPTRSPRPRRRSPGRRRWGLDASLPGSGAGSWERAAVGAGRASSGSTWKPTAAATLTRWSAPPALAPVRSWAAPTRSPRPRRRSPGRRRWGLDASLPGSGAGSWERAAVGAGPLVGSPNPKPTAAATLTRAPTIGP